MHLLQCFAILEEEKNKQNELVEEDVELKLVTQPETLLRNKEPSATGILSLSSSDLSLVQCAEVKEESQYSDELESEPVPNSSQSDVKSRVSNTILEDGSHSVIEAESPVTSGVCMLDLFNCSAHWILANSASSFSNPPGRKYSTRSVSTL